MTFTIPADLEKRISRVIAFSQWSNGNNDTPPGIQDWIVEQISIGVDSYEADMVLDEKGDFIGDKIWMVNPHPR